MERITLTKREKSVLLAMQSHGFDALSDFDTPSLRRLHAIGLVKIACVEGGGIEGAHLTTMGKEYLRCNPKLRNPINWKWLIPTIITIATFLLSLAAFLTACRALSSTQ